MSIVPVVVPIAGDSSGVLQDTTMDYNSESITHRGRVIESNTLSYQLTEAKEQATLKMQYIMNNLISGVQAIATAVVENGSIVRIDVTNPGSNYKFPPIVTIIAGGPITEYAVADSHLKDNTVESISMVQTGSGYTGLPVIQIASSTTEPGLYRPNTDPTLLYRTVLVERYEKEFEKGIGTPFNILPPYFSNGQVLNARITSSKGNITDPFYVATTGIGSGYAATKGTRRIVSRVKPPQGLEIKDTERPKQTYSTIQNTGKVPLEGRHYTHHTRTERNESAVYIIQQMTIAAELKTQSILTNGGQNAVITAGVVGTGVASYDPVKPGEFYTATTPTNSGPVLEINRMYNDPGKAQVVVKVDNGGAIISLAISNPATNIGYSAAYPPRVVFSTPDIGIPPEAEVTIVGESITAITLTTEPQESLYDNSGVVSVDIIRTLDDPGRATATVTAVDVDGKITHVTPDRNGTGYNVAYPPIVIITEGGKGSVTKDQEKRFLTEFIGDALIQPIPPAVPPSLPSTFYTDKNSAGKVINDLNSFRDIVDVTDKLTRKERLLYVNQLKVIDAKAEIAALARYYAAVANGSIPDVPPIPPPPVPPSVTITSTVSGGGASIEAIVSTSGVVYDLKILRSGSNYPSSPPVITFTNTTFGTGLIVQPVIENGGMTSIIVQNGGNGYVTPPTINISGGGGTGTIAQAVVSNLTVTSINVSNPGTGYLSIDIAGGGGTGARAIATTLNGIITSAAVTSGGSGYNIQEPPNPIYLQYLAEAEEIVEPIPLPIDNLPEPTLEDLPGNMDVKNLNEQKKASARAQSDIIKITINTRATARETFKIYQTTPTVDTLAVARTAYQIAIKNTAAAYALRKWKPSVPDQVAASKNILYPSP